MKKDIEKIEKVQRTATRMMMGGEVLDYESRLKRVGLTTLETRRLRADNGHVRGLQDYECNGRNRS